MRGNKIRIVLSANLLIYFVFYFHRIILQARSNILYMSIGCSLLQTPKICTTTGTFCISIRAQEQLFPRFSCAFNVGWC